MKNDLLIKAMLANQKLLLSVLKDMKDEDEEEEDEDEQKPMRMETHIRDAMVQAIKMTRSPHRTIGSNY
jgi:hypothetical protein